MAETETEIGLSLQEAKKLIKDAEEEKTNAIRS